MSCRDLESGSNPPKLLTLMLRVPEVQYDSYYEIVYNRISHNSIASYIRHSRFIIAL